MGKSKRTMKALSSSNGRFLTKRIRARNISSAVVGFRSGLRYIPPGIDTRSLVERLQSWVFIAIDKNSTEVSRFPIKLYSRDGKTPREKQRVLGKALQHLKASQQAVPDDVVEVLDHPALDLFDRPNPMLTSAGFLYLVASYLQMFGECFIYRMMGGMTPLELWPLPNPYVRPILGEKHIIDEYEFKIGGRVQRFPQKDIYHIRKPSPIDMISGLSQLRGILYSAESNQRMLEWENAVYQNFAVPDLLISPDDEDVTQEQIDQLTADWNERYGGWRQRGKVAIAPFKLKMERMDQSAKELAHVDARKWSREEIFAGFGIPISIATTEGTTFNNLHHGTVLWSRNTIQPMQTTIAGGLNHQCMPDYLPEVTREDIVVRKAPFFFGFDNPVPEDEDAATDRRIKRVAGGLLSYNEGRAEEGNDPVDGGDEVRIQGGLVRLTDPTQAQITTNSIALGTSVRDAESAAAAAERERRWQIEDEDRATELAKRDQLVIPPLSELTAAMATLSQIGDTDALNLVRERLADLLSGTLSPVSKLEAAPSAAVVNENKPEAKPIPAVSQGGMNGEQQPKPEEEEAEEKDKNRPKEQRQKSATSHGQDCTCGECDAGPGESDYRGCGGWPEYPNKLSKTVDDLLSKMSLESVDKPKGTFEAAMGQTFSDMGAVIRAKVLGGGTIDLFDFDEWRERFGKAGMQFLERAFGEGAIAGAGDLAGLGIVESPEAMLLEGTAMQAEVAKLADTFASSVVDVTGQDLAQVMAAGIQAGENPNQLADRVAALYGQKRDVSAKRIARTELNVAANAGAVATWRKAGVTRHKWLASVDACEFCLTLDGKVVDLGEPFVGLGAIVKGKDGGSFKVNYRSVLHPPLHPNDRCTIVPIVEGLS